MVSSAGLFGLTPAKMQRFAMFITNWVKWREIGREHDLETRTVPYLTRIHLWKLRPWVLRMVGVALTAITGSLTPLLLAVVVGEFTGFVHGFGQSDPDQLHSH